MKPLLILSPLLEIRKNTRVTLQTHPLWALEKAGTYVATVDFVAFVRGS